MSLFLYFKRRRAGAASPIVTPLGQPRSVQKWTRPASRFRLILLVLLNDAAAACVRKMASVIPIQQQYGTRAASHWV